MFIITNHVRKALVIAAGAFTLTLFGVMDANAQQKDGYEARGRGGLTGEQIEKLPPAKTVTLENQQLEIDRTYEEGLLALSEGDYETAAERFGTLIRSSTEGRHHPQLNYFMALAQLGLNDIHEAEKYLLRAVRYKDDYIEARETLALVEINLGNISEAEAQYAALQDMQADCDGDSNCDSARLEEAINKVGAALA